MLLSGHEIGIDGVVMHYGKRISNHFPDDKTVEDTLSSVERAEGDWLRLFEDPDMKPLKTGLSDMLPYVEMGERDLNFFWVPTQIYDDVAKLDNGLALGIKADAVKEMKHNAEYFSKWADEKLGLGKFVLEHYKKNQDLNDTLNLIEAYGSPFWNGNYGIVSHMVKRNHINDIRDTIDAGFDGRFACAAGLELQKNMKKIFANGGILMPEAEWVKEAYDNTVAFMMRFNQIYEENKGKYEDKEKAYEVCMKATREAIKQEVKQN